MYVPTYVCVHSYVLYVHMSLPVRESCSSSSLIRSKRHYGILKEVKVYEDEALVCIIPLFGSQVCGC